MTFIAQKKTYRVYVVSVFWLMISCSCLFMGVKVWRQAELLTLRNATDSLMLLVELKSESGGNYIKAKADYIEMLRQYVRHMESRHYPLLLLLPPFSKKNVAKKLERVVEDLEKADPLNAREAIEKASESITEFLITEFLTESKPFTDEPSIAFAPEAIPEEIRTAIVESVKESHEKAEIYANDPNMANSEAAHQANRKAIVYLYAARYGYQKTVSQETLREFRTDVNRTVYYNRALQQTDAIKGGEGVKDSDYWLLDRRSCSEVLHLRLLQLIIDNDIQQAQVLLQIAASGHGGAIPDIQF